VSGPTAPDHVVVDLDGGGHESQRRCADVLYGTGGPQLAEQLLERYPGCLLVCLRDARGRCVALSRTGRQITVSTVPPVGKELEHAFLAAMLHRWLVEVSSRPACATARPDAGRPSD
jgi:hypothetical protein